MRILFSAVPAPGHVLPLMPMAAAARSAGHAAAVLTSAQLVDLVSPLEAVVAGPGIAEQIAETVRRVGFRWTGPGPEAAEMFAGTRVDVTYEEALPKVREFDPDLIVCESVDYVGPTIAGALGVPWASYAISGGLPPMYTRALHERWSAQLEARGLSAVAPLAHVDPYPDLLRGVKQTPVTDRIRVRPAPFDRVGASYQAPVFENEDLPRVLLTLGTAVDEPDVAAELIESVADAGHNVLVTAAATAGQLDAPRVRYLGFVPLARVLPDADLVVTAGGTGTVLSALAAGLPMVIRPFMADQPLNAEAAARAGVARVITESFGAGQAVRDVLADPGYREVAQQEARQMAMLPSPAEALDDLTARLPGK